MRIELPNAELYYYPEFFPPLEASALFNRLKDETVWQQDYITIFGKTHLQPRLTALYGDEGKTLSYSGISMKSHPWTPLLEMIREKIAGVCDQKFNTVLLNLYRDGRDSNGWHTDNESYLGKNPVIASVTLGEQRAFHIRHNFTATTKKLMLEHGSLLVMAGEMQHFWKHQIPKTSKPVGPRINLTFRFVYS